MIRDDSGLWPLQVSVILSLGAPVSHSGIRTKSHALFHTHTPLLVLIYLDKIWTLGSQNYKLEIFGTPDTVVSFAP